MHLDSQLSCVAASSTGAPAAKLQRQQCARCVAHAPCAVVAAILADQGTSASTSCWSTAHMCMGLEFRMIHTCGAGCVWRVVLFKGENCLLLFAA
jgi:hypothetical protein